MYLDILLLFNIKILGDVLVGNVKGVEKLSIQIVWIEIMLN